MARRLGPPVAAGSPCSGPTSGGAPAGATARRSRTIWSTPATKIPTAMTMSSKASGREAK